MEGVQGMDEMDGMDQGHEKKRCRKEVKELTAQIEEARRRESCSLGPL